MFSPVQNKYYLFIYCVCIPIFFRNLVSGLDIYQVCFCGMAKTKRKVNNFAYPKSMLKYWYPKHACYGYDSY